MCMLFSKPSWATEGVWSLSLWHKSTFITGFKVAMQKTSLKKIEDRSVGNISFLKNLLLRTFISFQFVFEDNSCTSHFLTQECGSSDSLHYASLDFSQPVLMLKPVTFDLLLL